ncbi:unnamed protein product, partial [Ixodes pacificus]
RCYAGHSEEHLPASLSVGAYKAYKTKRTRRTMRLRRRNRRRRIGDARYLLCKQAVSSFINHTGASRCDNYIPFLRTSGVFQACNDFHDPVPSSSIEVHLAPDLNKSQYHVWGKSLIKFKMVCL